MFNRIFQKQLDSMDCAPACLKMIATYYGIKTSMHQLRDLCHTTRNGTSTAELVQAAGETGLSAGVFLTTVDYLKNNLPLPCILHWRNNHYVVLQKIKAGKYTIADPGYGMIILQEKEFIKEWKGPGEKGVAIFLEPNGGQGKKEGSPGKDQLSIFRHFRNYLRSHTRSMLALVFIMLIAALISLVIPKTIQYMTDNGVEKKNIPVIWKVLIFQFVLFGALTLTNYIKSLIQAKLSTGLSTGIISDFLAKLLRLPISFFDSRTNADIHQRITDHSRIETFLGTKLVNFFFSLLLMAVYIIQFFWLDRYIVISFLLFTGISVIWFFLFLNKRKKLDYHRFSLAVEERNYLNDLIGGMTEIKLNNAQHDKIIKWSEMQQKLYGFKLSSLKLTGLQQYGVSTINQLKSLFITFLCSYWVINEQISFGVMLSIGYIVGQLAVPVQDLMLFFQDLQDAKTSFERLNEIQLKDNENNEDKMPFPVHFKSGFRIEGLSFKYPGAHNPYVLRNIDLFIPKGKITAIVGTSGSGKTTLMKLLLAFYTPQNGAICIDDINLKNINTEELRAACGVVMQGGYIYNATIAQNIAMTDRNINLNSVYQALRLACLDEFVQSLPLKHNTLLGKTGIELSGGQKQRLFIARAVYKNPKIILLDEATNSLDANNERAIMNNLADYFVGKTVLVIAHRLSTVKNADLIVVLEKGVITETGTHAQLTKNQGRYFELVKNQLELG
ncbi:peptidase domain-containing ABC transporter [Niastella caeni]|uniref:Peptidase domain-containing ABC transporter n=1 Tax=Niastella caeni TaxID=2569763 RepID=A0A4V4H1G2_9BACT|nr:peptidase domain-containing ABC transporter [Niastella caeni]THU40346.1 peptidase domain-containing ABC transporter [Niastella caeni]